MENRPRKFSILSVGDAVEVSNQPLTENPIFLAYSVCYDGTEIITGNLGVEELNAALGGITIKVPSEISVDGMILRNVRKQDINTVLRDHKNYLNELEIVRDPNLAERLAKAYQRLNTSELS